MNDELKAKIEAIRELANNTTINEWRIAPPNPQTMLEILAYIDQLEKQVDWLAEVAVGGDCHPNDRSGIEYWKKAAEKAVEAEEDNTEND